MIARYGHIAHIGQCEILKMWSFLCIFAFEKLIINHSGFSYLNSIDFFAKYLFGLIELLLGERKYLSRRKK